MNNREWLRQLSNLTGLPYYEEHKVFGDKSGALIGTRDGYIVALGLGKADGGHSGVKMLLRYAKTQDPKLIKQALDPAKGKFKQVSTDETTAILVQTYSLGKPDAAKVAEPLPSLLAAMKTCAAPIGGKCEECGRDEPQMVLLNDIPTRYCPSCQVQLKQKLDAAAIEYENLETNLPLGLLYGAGAALLGSIAWGGVAYLLRRIFPLGRYSRWAIREQSRSHGNRQGHLDGPRHDRCADRRQRGFRGRNFLCIDRDEPGSRSFHGSPESGSCEFLEN
jgi:hypothetical protein